MRVSNIDKFGHCILCHRNLLRNMALNGRIEQVFHPDKDETWLQLNNGSMMSICLCRECKQGNDFDDIGVRRQVMEAVHNGWQLEMELMAAEPQKYGFTIEKRIDLEQYYNTLSDYKHMPDFKLI